MLRDKQGLPGTPCPDGAGTGNEEIGMGLGLDFEFELYHKWQRGALNLITDVPGVRVGHTTLTDPEAGIHTGCTAIVPHSGNLFRDKCMAGAAVLNGFGKSAGLIQVEELGTIETPIVLTSTFSVGTALNALVRRATEENPEIGVTTGTVNSMVMECNDGELNDIRGCHLTEDDVHHAIAAADSVFAEGAVGGGTGMVCMDLKGGIGSASRLVPMDEKEYTIGALVMSNFGVAGNLIIGGRHVGREIAEGLRKADADKPEKGSIIIILATDLPLSDRQLRRVARRSAAALGRVGSFLGNGSGDIALAFTTANRVPHFAQAAVLETKMLLDDRMDPVFEAAVEAVEEAIISSLDHAQSVTGVRSRHVLCLRDAIKAAGVSVKD